MTGREGSLLERIERDGAAAALPEAERDVPTDAGRLAERLRTAASEWPDETAVLGAFEEAGRLHDPVTLDAVLHRVAPIRPIPFLGAARRSRLRRAARLAAVSTDELGALELACAVLGALGTAEDAPVLETAATHPRLTLHAATALSNLAHWQGRASLLRLLSRTEGEARVVVIDRLLPHTREPAVRLALVRDALRGLAPEHAREVAADIAERCGVRRWIDDPAVPEDVRAGARLVLASAGAAPD